jgi:Tol biopolymer transport system component
MPFAAGSRLGPYELLAPLGAGGMGEVYRARDPRLDREVAVKVLPAEVLGNPDRLRRFEHEARAAGALSHPNVLAVFDVGEQDGVPYIVSELLEGEGLRGATARGAFSAARAMEYGAQVADGLAAAHEKGIVHRDLKPDNLFLTREGRVKILDFGLAKLRRDDSRPAEVESKTLTVKTAPGTILGTAAYMSPEQVRGEPSDHRSDIFSLGVVLYEMLTGTHPFKRRSEAETLHAILAEEPAASTPGLLPEVRRILSRCLEKRPEDRFQSARDLALDLRQLAETGTRTEPARLGARPWAVEIATMVVVAGVAAVVGYRVRPAAERTVVRFSIAPEGATLSFDVPVVSPDGSRVAFVASRADGIPRVFLRALDSLATETLPGTERAANPFWSPDGRSVAFFSAGKLKRLDLTTKATHTVCDVTVGGRGTWGARGDIVFAPGYSGGLYRVPAAGGDPLPATSLDPERQETNHTFPQFLPDGDHFLYLGRSVNYANTTTVLASLASKDTRRLDAGWNAIYTDGHLLFMREATLMARPFDLGRLQFTGEPWAVQEQVAAFSASRNGVLAYRPGDPLLTELIWSDRAGKRLGAVGPPGYYAFPALSRDGTLLVVAQRDLRTGNVDNWIYDLASGRASRFTFDPAVDHAAIWSPDGGEIVFDSTRTGVHDLFRKPTSGATETVLLKTAMGKGATDYSKDGRFVVYQTLDAVGRFDIWALPMAGDGKPFPVARTPADEVQGQLSPDVRWLAFSSDESGEYRVYVQSFPSAGAGWQVSAGGGDQPRWREDGRELFYVRDDGKLMAVEVKLDRRGEGFGTPSPLFDTELQVLTAIMPAGTFRFPRWHQYVVSPDGQRFLVNTPADELRRSPIEVATSWKAGIR